MCVCMCVFGTGADPAGAFHVMYLVRKKKCEGLLCVVVLCLVCMNNQNLAYISGKNSDDTYRYVYQVS